MHADQTSLVSTLLVKTRSFCLVAFVLAALSMGKLCQSVARARAPVGLDNFVQRVFDFFKTRLLVKANVPVCLVLQSSHVILLDNIFDPEKTLRRVARNRLWVCAVNLQTAQDEASIVSQLGADCVLVNQCFEL